MFKPIAMSEAICPSQNICHSLTPPESTNLRTGQNFVLYQGK